MDTQQVIAPPRARSAETGVIHSNVRHTAGFTVIGNHLAQHRGLSLVAVGLAAHIQSLPAGARIGIKRLAERFPESETRIASALRELEAAGYLHRSRVRLADGRIVPRTVSYNRPGAPAPSAGPDKPGRSESPGRPAEPTRLSRPERPGRSERPSRPESPSSPAEPTSPSKPDKPSGPATPTRPVGPPAPGVTAGPAPEQPTPPPPRPDRGHVPPPTARTAVPVPLPQPRGTTPEFRRTASALLADLRRHTPQLVLSEADVRALVPGVVAWLERDAHPDTVRHALTADLPVPLRHPAKLLRHRITALLPPPLPGAPDLARPARPGVTVIPLQNCDRCDRAFRSRHPGHCRDCRTGLPAAV
ncbi:helix-turn-helix domain-containing protein [Streptomyces sp. NPDC058008]|uniref:helix-turn-helix domain-containing protein n=1 Tax=Streptomyces sp. NPDC058008 TaxID=3346303 RepID=UPI0036EB7BB2